MTEDILLRRIGEALYGGLHWYSKLSEELSLNRRTIARWLSGADEIPEGIWDDLDRMLAERAGEVDELRKEITRLRTPPPGAAA